jgi:hypothetical protein
MTGTYHRAKTQIVRVALPKPTADAHLAQGSSKPKHLVEVETAEEGPIENSCSNTNETKTSASHQKISIDARIKNISGQGRIQQHNRNKFDIPSLFS